MRCMNPKLLAGIVAVGLAVALFAPGFGRALGPLLIVAACPLSMIVMMAMMGRSSSSKRSQATSTELDPRATRSSERGAEIAELRERLARLEGSDSQVPGRA
jgi:choline-glycine betaine transporter